MSKLAFDYSKWDNIEISDDDALVEQYGTRIPVLVDANGVELDRGENGVHDVAPLLPQFELRHCTFVL